MSFAQSLTLAQSASRGLAPLASASGGKKVNAKAWAAAQNFEASFLGSMFENMFTDIDGEGPFGGGQATGIWRSFLTQEYAKTNHDIDPILRTLNIGRAPAPAGPGAKPGSK